MPPKIVPPSFLVQIEQIIRNKLSIDAWILKDQKFMNLILQYVFWFNRNAKIDQVWFKTIFSLIQSFKLPIMYAFKKAYERIKKMKVLNQYKKSVCQIMNLVKRILIKCSSTGQADLKFFDLEFYQVNFNLKTDSDIPLIIDEQDRRFFKLILDLTSLINHFEKKVNNLCNRKHLNPQDSAVCKEIKLIENIYKVLVGEKQKASEKYTYLEIKFIQKIFLEVQKIHQMYLKQIETNQFYQKDQNDNLLQISNRETQNLVQKLNQSSHDAIAAKNKSKNIFNFQNDEKPIRIARKLKLQEPIQILSDAEQETKDIQSENQEMDSKKINTPLCCRQFFIYQENLESQSMRVQYKNYSLPFQQFQGQTLLKTICSFLNSDGGIIYMGVEENGENFKRLVKGQFCNQKTKQDILKYFRVSIQKIYPDIVANKFYQVFFVPVKKSNFHRFSNDQQYIQGRYIIKIVICPGLRKQLYSFTDGKGQHQFYFRTENQVITVNLKRDIRKLLQIHRERILTPREQPMKIHEGKCLLPQKGLQSYNDSSKKVSFKFRNSQPVKSKPNYNKKSDTMSKLLEETYFQENNSFLEKSAGDKKAKLKDKIKMKNQEKQAIIEKVINRKKDSTKGHSNQRKHR